MNDSAIKTQTAINEVYRNAIITALVAAEVPQDREALATTILGGFTPTEAGCIATEPYVPALLSLVMDGTVAYYHDPETNFMVAVLTGKATPEAIQQSQDLLAKRIAEHGEIIPNDPSTWRMETPAEAMKDFANFLADVAAAARAADSLRAIFETAAPTAPGDVH